MFNAQEMSKTARERSNITMLPADIIMRIEEAAKLGKFKVNIERYSHHQEKLNDNIINQLKLLGFTVEISDKKYEDKPGFISDMRGSIIYNYTISWPM